MNRWNYTQSNPVNYADPSGHCAGYPDDPNNPDIECWKKLKAIEDSYSNIKIDAENWSTEELESVETSLEYMVNTLGGTANFTKIINKDITLYNAETTWWTDGLKGRTASGTGTITIYDEAFYTDAFAEVTIIHEFGHLVDAKYDGLSMDTEFRDKFWSDCVPNIWNDNCSTVLWFYSPQCEGLSASSYACTSPREDFSELYAYYVLVDNNCDNSLIFKELMPPDQDRIDYMKNLIQKLNEQKK